MGIIFVIDVAFALTDIKAPAVFSGRILVVLFNNGTILPCSNMCLCNKDLLYVGGRTMEENLNTLNAI